MEETYEYDEFLTTYIKSLKRDNILTMYYNIFNNVNKLNNSSYFGEDGYEVTYPDGYKSWSPAKEFEKAYYKLEDPAGDTLKENDIKRFIKGIENVKVGTKTTNTTLTCLTGFEVHGQAACVKPENFDLNVGANYAQIKAEDKIWEGLGFVLQWAKYGLKK
jgi:hypothetical protein